MKHPILKCLLLAGLAGCAFAQLDQPNRYVTTAPAGACGKGARNTYDVVAGKYYGCLDANNDGTGVWTEITGGAAGVVYRGPYSGLPPASGYTNALAIVTDASSSACSAGGGAVKCLLEDTGSSWATVLTAAGVSGLGDAATKNTGTGGSDVAAGDRGVTNGDSHDHNGGAGAPVPVGGLAFDPATQEELDAVAAAKQNTLTDSAGLRGALSDETGTGPAMFGVQPTIDKPIVTGYNVSTLPTPAAGMTVPVGDSADGTCASGGGSIRVWCRYNGSAWLPLSQPYDADLMTYASITPSANVQSLLGAANYAAIRDLLTTSKLTCTSTPVTCTFYDDTAGTGRITLIFRPGAGQGSEPQATFRDAANNIITEIGADGSIANRVGGVRKVLIYGGIMGYSSDGSNCWRNNVDWDAGGAAVDTCLSRSAAGVTEVNNGTPGTLRDVKLRTIKQPPLTVATLPGSPAAGDEVSIGDSATGDCSSGGGSIFAKCRYNGSGWEAF